MSPIKIVKSQHMFMLYTDVRSGIWYYDTEMKRVSFSSYGFHPKEVRKLTKLEIVLYQNIIEELMEYVE